MNIYNIIDIMILGLEMGVVIVRGIIRVISKIKKIILIEKNRIIKNTI